MMEGLQLDAVGSSPDGLSCPSCGSIGIRTRARVSWIGVSLATCILLGLLSMSVRRGSSSVALVLTVIASVGSAWAFGTAIAATYSVVFGKNKCRSCGHKWRTPLAKASATVGCRSSLTAIIITVVVPGFVVTGILGIVAAVVIPRISFGPTRAQLIGTVSISADDSPGQLVTDLAFSHTGRMLAATVYTDVIKLIDVETRKHVRSLVWEGSDLIDSVLFSPDDSLILAHDGLKGAAILDLASGKLRFVVRCDIKHPAFSPNGMLLATGEENDGVLWDVTTGERICNLAGHTGRVWSIAFSLDGTKLASLGFDDDRRARLWDIVSGNQLAILGYDQNRPELSQHREFLESIAFSPDGAVVVTGGSRIWNTATLAESPVRLPGGTPIIFFDADTVILGQEHEIVVADLTDGRVRATLIGTPIRPKEDWRLDDGSPDYTFALSPDRSILAVAGRGTMVELWKFPEHVAK